MPHPIDTLISSCDGVLVDNEVVVERAIYETLSAYAPLEELRCLLEGTFGLISCDIFDRIRKHFGLHIPDSFSCGARQHNEEVVTQIQPILGVRKALLALDLPAAAAPNSRHYSLERSPTHAGLSELIGECLVSAGVATLSKPIPNTYLRAVNPLGIASERRLMVEDSSTSTRTTLTVGIRVIGSVGTGYIPAGHAEVLHGLGVIAIVKHMRELPETVARLRRENRMTLGTS